jgi:hypothetical protein
MGMSNENSTAEEMLIEVINQRDDARIALRDARTRIATLEADNKRLRDALSRYCETAETDESIFWNEVNNP